MIYYKVVIHMDGGFYTSAIIKGRAKTFYEPGIWVSAPQWLQDIGYHLCVFTNSKDAIDFLGNRQMMTNNKYEIWECECENVFKPALGRSEDLWLNCSYDLHDTDLSWPDGTIMAKRIKLTNKVKLPYRGVYNVY